MRMALFKNSPLHFFSQFLILSMVVITASARGPIYTPPTVDKLTDRFSQTGVSQGYNVLYGGHNIQLKNNGSTADLVLDKSSGSGLVSKHRYYYGFFNAAIKLPAGFTSGVVVAFYMSNQDVYQHNHDEIDIELLGYDKRRDWVLQTNLYGNGSVKTGREEKFYLWFDPTQASHDYSILWNSHHILFLVDNIPVREVVNNAAISTVYPSKPMSVYVTIWDGSEWATHGGKYPVNYKYAPFVASMGRVELEGCTSSSSDCTRRSPSSLEGEGFVKLTQQQISGLQWARGKHMFYSYCQDKARYKVLPPECSAK